jgi:hypothetical protein
MRQQTYASQMRHYDRHMHTYRIGEATALAGDMARVSADLPRPSSAHNRFA